MAYQRNYFRPSFPAKEILCSCGGAASLITRTNYPFGQKSKKIVSKFYRCAKCGKLNFLNNPGGKNNAKQKFKR